MKTRMKTKELDKATFTYDEMCDRVEAACKAAGREPEVRFSAYDTKSHKGLGKDTDWIVYDNLDEVPIEGRVVIFEPGDQFWGGDETRDYKSPILHSPTWLELCVIANEMMHVTGDMNHCFVESISPMNTSLLERLASIDLDGGEGEIQVCQFFMGS